MREFMAFDHGGQVVVADERCSTGELHTRHHLVSGVLMTGSRGNGGQEAII